MSVYSNNRFNKAAENEAWSKIFKFIPAKSRILDVGCSSGKLGEALKKEKDVYVVGLDIDAADVELAKKNLDEAFVLNAEHDDLESLGRFDVIIMADVVEHLVDPVGVLKKLKPLLKAQGRFVFSIPNMANVTTRIEVLRGRFEYKDFGLLDRTHLHFYDEEEVNRVLRASGFEVVKTDCTIREIPESILEKSLGEIGITLTPQLMSYLNDTNALIYQFIGYAQPTRKPSRFHPETTSPLDVVSQSIDELNAKHQQELEEKNQKIQYWQSEYKRVVAELGQILNSKGWKLLSRVFDAKARAGKSSKNN